MKVTRFLAIAVIALAGISTSGYAQSLNSASASPAERPPSSFRGGQFVDSRGCVFIRAGIDGRTTWVPRVTRQRTPICNQTPTFQRRVATAPAPAPAPAPQPAPAAAAPAPSPTPQQTAPAPRRVVTAPAPRPAPLPRRVVQAPAAAPAPAPVPQRTVPAAPAPTRQVATCGSISPVTGNFIATRPAPGQPCTAQRAPATVRSVPAGSGVRVVQTAPRRAQGSFAAPRSGAAVGAVVPRAQVTSLPPNTRVVPRHVQQNRLASGVQPVPQGYRRAWEDDRLNTRRAEQTVAGIQRTDLIWTNTVPRRLINRATGQDVTRNMPLVYPFTDVVTQQRQLGTVTLAHQNGQVVKRVQRNAAAPAPTVSTRSAPKPVAPRAPVQSASTLQGQGLVQAALYRDDAGARAAAQRVGQLGLPVQLGTIQHRGETLKMVMVGPFASGDAQVGALRRVRAAGFANARLR